MCKLKPQWVSDAAKLLIGKKVTEVRYLTENEQSHLGWNGASLVLFFDDGSYIFPSSDDEGNDAGAFFTSSKSLPTIPVIR